MSLYQRLIKKTLRENVIPFTDDRSRSSWRKKILREFGEWAPIETSGPANSTSTTFGYFSGGSPVINGETGQQVTFTYSGLQGVENYPTSVTIDQGFGDTFQTDPPPFSQLGVQGYTAKLNPRYKEAQEKYKKEYDEFEEKRDANFQAIKDTLKSFGTSWEEMRASKKWVKKLSDGTVVSIVRTSSNPSPMNWTNNVRVTKMKQSPNASGPITINYNPPNEYYEWVVENAEIQNEVYLEIGEPPEPPMESEYLMPRRTDYRDVNPLLDASQEFAQQVGADYMMNARVQQIAQVMDGENLLPPDLQDILRRARNEPANSGSTAGERDKRKILDFLETPEGQKITPQMFDRLMNIYMRSQTNQYGIDYGNIASTSLKGLVSNPPSQEVAQNVVTPEDEAFIDYMERYPGLVNFLLPGQAAPATSVIDYARGNYRDITQSPGISANKSILKIISRVHKGGRSGSVTAGLEPNSPPSNIDIAYPKDPLNALLDSPMKNFLNQFKYEATPNGVRIIDTFNFNGNRNTGALGNIPIIGPDGRMIRIQDVADRLAEIGDKRARSMGLNPSDDSLGAKIDFTIPWSQVSPELQNKLDTTATIIPTVKRRKRNRRGRVVESTWDRIQKHRKTV